MNDAIILTGSKVTFLKGRKDAAFDSFLCFALFIDHGV